MSLKDAINLSTDTGTNVLALLTPVLTYVLSLPDGPVKQILVGLCVTAISVNLYLIKGSKAQVAQGVDYSKNIEEVLKAGREPADANQPSGN